MSKRRGAKAPNTGVYENIPYDSGEELAFLQWAFELKKAGYIKSIERSESFLLSDPMQINYAQQLKTKSKPMTQHIMAGHSYTPEFLIIWNLKGSDVFVDDFKAQKKQTKLFLGYKDKGYGLLHTYVEIKPMFDQNNMERLFRLNQKWMWQKHGIYVNLVKCPELFAKTFTPQEYLKTRTGKQRLIKWRTRSMWHYLKG